MSGRRHVVAGSSPWRSGGKGAEDRHRDREGENGEAGGERSSSETLTTATATATATTHTSFDIKRFINDKLDSRHRDKEKDDNSLTVVPPHHTSDSSAPTRPGSVSPTPTQFSPTSTAVMASPPPSTSNLKVLASPSKVWFHFVIKFNSRASLGCDCRCALSLSYSTPGNLRCGLESVVPVVMVCAHLVSNCAHSKSSKHSPASFGLVNASGRRCALLRCSVPNSDPRCGLESVVATVTAFNRCSIMQPHARSSAFLLLYPSYCSVPIAPLNHSPSDTWTGKC